MSVKASITHFHPPSSLPATAKTMSALNEATNTRVGTALSASLASPEVTKRAYEDVQALARTIQQARGSFALVSTALTWWDIVGLRDPQGHPVVLGAKWRDLINVRPPRGIAICD